ncbi:MAG TPA: deoxyribose-phosphate aldolase [Polyangiaceae bacterium]|jgi:deoxyribose-phosphate aldolase
MTGSPTYVELAKLIDHSLLAPTLRDDELAAGCVLARECDVASVCILPFFMRRCAEILAGSGVVPSTTIGFPHGGHATAVKLDESRVAISDGARELDMVVNVGKVKSGDFAYVRAELAAVIDEAHARGCKVKVIFETCYLSEHEKIRLCELCSELSADWAKTSTGFGPAGATLEDLRLMRARCAPQVQIKASGGIRELDFMLAARAIGVTRIGSSRTREILADARRRLGG